MDYGTWLAKTVENPNRKSKHYIKQSKFEGSKRQVRGSIIRELLKGERSREELAIQLGFDLLRVCLLYTSPSPRDRTRSRMPSSA